jgi:hypothetical protein
MARSPNRTIAAPSQTVADAAGNIWLIVNSQIRVYNVQLQSPSTKARQIRCTVMCM